MDRFCYIDTNTGAAQREMDGLFPGWAGAREHVCVYSPHDDDAILGAGYAMRAALDAGAQVSVIIVCSGNAGYSDAREKHTIVETRRRETRACYAAFGIAPEHLLFLDAPDFSALHAVGWQVPGGAGHFQKTITYLRAHEVTRILAPNHYREHIDHVAASMMAAYDAPQAGDAFAVDWAKPHAVTSVAEYAVWAELDPEDALLAGRDTALRANCVLAVAPEVEASVMRGIAQYASQVQIIETLTAARRERRLPNGRYIEVYLRFDPRPKMDFSPYKALIARTDGSSAVD